MAQHLIWLVVAVLVLLLWKRSTGIQHELNYGHPHSSPEPPSKGTSSFNAPVKTTVNGFFRNQGQGINWAGISAGKGINAVTWLLPCALTGSCPASHFRDSQSEKGLLTTAALQPESKFQSSKSDFEKGGNQLYSKNEFVTTSGLKDEVSTLRGAASSTVISGPTHVPSPSGECNFSATDLPCKLFGCQCSWNRVWDWICWRSNPRQSIESLRVWPCIWSLMMSCKHEHAVVLALTYLQHALNIILLDGSQRSLHTLSRLGPIHR